MDLFCCFLAKRNIKRGSFIGRHFSPGVTLSLTNVLLLVFLFAKETPKVAHLSRTILPEGHVRKTPRSQRFDAPIVRDKWTLLVFLFQKETPKVAHFVLDNVTPGEKCRPINGPLLMFLFAQETAKEAHLSGDILLLRTACGVTCGALSEERSGRIARRRQVVPRPPPSHDPCGALRSTSGACPCDFAVILRKPSDNALRECAAAQRSTSGARAEGLA